MGESSAQGALKNKKEKVVKNKFFKKELSRKTKSRVERYDQ